jgi:tetratricopeptide (TPR) repeat protein
MRNLLILALFGAVTSIPSGFGQTGYTPGEFQAANANYPVRNPFYFEGRIDWDLLKITQPSNAWEFAQRGIHEQDDLLDTSAAIADYKTSVSMNNLQDRSCQLITAAPTGFGQKIDPPPCMFTVRLRLGNLVKASDPTTALQMFDEVLTIDPLRLGVNTLIGETYSALGDNASNSGDQEEFYREAVAAYEAELALSPVTDLSIKLTGDEANNAHVHWALAGLYDKLGETKNEVTELDLYLKATKWHSDTYPWRIQIAQGRMQKLMASSVHNR